MAERAFLWNCDIHWRRICCRKVMFEHFDKDKFMGILSYQGLSEFPLELFGGRPEGLTSPTTCKLCTARATCRTSHGEKKE